MSVSGSTPPPSRDGADLPPSSAVEAPTGTSQVRATWDAVEALAAILEPESFDPDQPAVEGWREATMNVARAHAAKVISEGWRPLMAILAAGYRRVVDDDTTVDRVARAIHDAECGPEPHCKLTDEHFGWDVRLARAAI